MKKKIVTFVSCILVAVALIVPTFAASIDLQFIIDHANPVDPYLVNDPAYDTDKTPDIYIEAPKTPTAVTPSDYSPLYKALGYANFEYLNIVTGKESVLRSQIAVFYLSVPNSDLDTDWKLNVYYFDDTNTSSTYTYSVEYDRVNGYWFSSYYPHLQIKSFNLEIYVGVYDDIMLDESSLFGGDFTVEYPYIGGDYSYNKGYDSGIKNGQGLGWEDGYTYGYDIGKQDGYDIGLTDGANTDTGWMNFKNLIFTIFDAPFYVLSTALNFEIFGINIAGTLISLISIALIVWILKIIVVKLF